MYPGDWGEVKFVDHETMVCTVSFFCADVMLKIAMEDLMFVDKDYIASKMCY